MNCVKVTLGSREMTVEKVGWVECPGAYLDD